MKPAPALKYPCDHRDDWGYIKNFRSRMLQCKHPNSGRYRQFVGAEECRTCLVREKAEGRKPIQWESIMDEYGWWTRTVKYDDRYYSARCPECARFVKCDETAELMAEFGDVAKPNATCKKHGRVKTPFLAWAWDCEEPAE